MKTHKANKIFKLALLALLLWSGLDTVGIVHAQVVANPGTSAITPQTQQVETGPLLDVVPYVLSDGYTINLTLIPSLTDFNGYDKVPDITSVTSGLNVVQLPVILPDFTVRQVVTTVNIWDNQTVVIGGLVSSQVATETDKIPMLGDLPFLGKLFQSQTKSSLKKNLMIFVTATIVDPAGNRVHSDDELPFAQSPLPPQPLGAGKMTETVEPAAASAVTPEVIGEKLVTRVDPEFCGSVADY